MNTYAGIILLLWLGGWTLAMVRAGLLSRAMALAPVAGEKLPGKAAGVDRR